MWESIAQNGGVVLGLAISLYTVYSFAEARIVRNRRRYALLMHLHDEVSYFAGLADRIG